ncbi:MAG TPA: glycosyltransferase N-terminal domain-containing protein, partial [Segetibacter sp.]
MLAKNIYKVFTTFYPVSIKLVSPFNYKARLWLKGRKDIFKRLNTSISPADKIIWMHCASLGEFEQGRPVIEKLCIAYPSYKILLTFFSPSGYEVRKDYDGADYIFYLPMDSKENAKRFFDIVNPALVIFVKYEFWHYYLNEAQNRQIPLLLISAIFRKSQKFFSRQGNFYRQMLS